MLYICFLRFCNIHLYFYFDFLILKTVATHSALPNPNSSFRRFILAHRHVRGPRRQRTTFTHEQTLRLEMEFHCNEYITRSKRFQLAELLELSENQIKIWFQNRRAKDKRIEKAIVEQQYRYDMI